MRRRAQAQLHFRDGQQRAFGISNISYSWQTGYRYLSFHQYITSNGISPISYFNSVLTYFQVLGKHVKMNIQKLAQ